MARCGAVRFASVALRCVGFGSVRFGFVRFSGTRVRRESRLCLCSSSIWAGSAAQLAAMASTTASGFQCAFNNKFNCLHDVGKVQRRRAGGWRGVANYPSSKQLFDMEITKCWAISVDNWRSQSTYANEMRAHRVLSLHAWSRRTIQPDRAYN